MEQQVARDLANVLRTYMIEKGHYEVIERSRVNGELVKFHQDANNRPCEGAFLVKKPDGISFWITLMEWDNRAHFGLFLLSESRAEIFAEIHKCDENTLSWTYVPKKQDGKNPERITYFEEVFQSKNVLISLPSKTRHVDDFFGELHSLIESRRKADILDMNKPLKREGFPEGKLKEHLHLSRERNPKVISEAKRFAIQRDGCLLCRCCGFNFEKVYGDLGKDFIEAHHTKPLSTLHVDGEITHVEDIALVCSNCHRMLHRRRPWLGLQELANILR